MREMKRSIAICVATVAVWLSVAPLLGDTEPCTVVPSPPPATLDIRVLQTNPPLLIGAGNDWCSNDITLVTMPVPLKFEVDVSGLDPEGAQEHRIRAGQFFLQYTSESCAGGSSAFDSPRSRQASLTLPIPICRRFRRNWAGSLSYRISPAVRPGNCDTVLEYHFFRRSCP